jgi:hypothetical protein
VTLRTRPSAGTSTGSTRCQPPAFMRHVSCSVAVETGNTVQSATLHLALHDRQEQCRQARAAAELVLAGPHYSDMIELRTGRLRDHPGARPGRFPIPIRSPTACTGADDDVKLIGRVLTLSASGKR